MNLLTLQIVENRKIVGLKIEDKEFLINHFADDTILFLDGSIESLREAFRILRFFEECSGLKINRGKNRAIWTNNVNRKFDEFDIDWDQGNFKVLGIDFSHDLNETVIRNFSNKIREISSLLESWQHRKLTLMGKTLIIKQLCLSKLVHIAFTLPLPDEEFFKSLDKMFYNILWDGKPDKIARTTVIQNWIDGGLGFPKAKLFLSNLRLKWIKKYVEHLNLRTVQPH